MRDLEKGWNCPLTYPENPPDEFLCHGPNKHNEDTCHPLLELFANAEIARPPLRESYQRQVELLKLRMSSSNGKAIVFCMMKQLLPYLSKKEKTHLEAHGDSARDNRTQNENSAEGR